MLYKLGQMFPCIKKKFGKLFFQNESNISRFKCSEHKNYVVSNSSALLHLIMHDFLHSSLRNEQIIMTRLCLLLQHLSTI